VHRDLKPANVLLAEDGPRVIDFGISRAADASMLTQAGTIMGSPGFLSPEQAEGLPLDARSEVFSFGTVLYEVLSGARAFAGLGAVLRDEPPPRRKPPLRLPAIFHIASEEFYYLASETRGDAGTCSEPRHPQG